MNRRLARIGGLVALAVRCVCAGSTSEDLRVYAVEPARFDYVFTAVTGAGTTNPLLSFNHRNGRTLFVHPGECLGDYQVAWFQPETGKVFNASIHTWQARKGGRVSLQPAKGAPVQLTLGQRLPQPGWMAYLVSLADGNWWLVREGDDLVRGAISACVQEIATNHVVLSREGLTNSVPLMTDEESTRLATVWSAKAHKPDAQGSPDAPAPLPEAPFDAVARPQDEVPVPVVRPVTRVVLTTPSRSFFGTDYSCPADYTVLPAIWNANGQLVRPPVFIPRRFERYRGGFSIETR